MTVSKPIVYASLLAVVVYAATMLNSNEPPKKAVKPMPAAKKPTGDVIFTTEDLKAHFASYTSQPKDAFLPKVIPVGAALKGNSKQPVMGKWMLTGVNTINGATTAVLENDSTHSIEILHQGDTFNGSKVVSIEPLAVNFTNKLNQISRLPFVDPEPPKETVTSAAPANPNPNGFGRSGSPFGGAGGFPGMNGGGFGGMGGNFQNPGMAGAPTDTNTPTDTTQAPNNGGGGGRQRGRRNRGGGN